MTYNMYVYIYIYSVYKVDYRGAAAPKKHEKPCILQVPVDAPLAPNIILISSPHTGSS